MTSCDDNSTSITHESLLRASSVCSLEPLGRLEPPPALESHEHFLGFMNENGTSNNRTSVDDVERSGIGAA